MADHPQYVETFPSECCYHLIAAVKDPQGIDWPRIVYEEWVLESWLRGFLFGNPNKQDILYGIEEGRVPDELRELMAVLSESQDVVTYAGPIERLTVGMVVKLLEMLAVKMFEWIKAELE